MTRIIVSSQNKKTITGHAGRCRKFWRYTVDNQQVVSKELVETSKEASLHNVFSDMDKGHPIFDADVFITGSIGPGAIRKLDTKQVKVVVTPETDPDLAVEHYLDGSIKQMSLIEIQQNHQAHHLQKTIHFTQKNKS